MIAACRSTPGAPLVAHNFAGHQRRREKPGTMEPLVTKMQGGEYLGGDDIVRFRDHCAGA